MKIIYPEFEKKKEIDIEEINDSSFKASFNSISEVEIGDPDSPDFIPEIKVKKWNDTFLKIKFPSSKKLNPVKVKKEGKLKKVYWRDEIDEIDLAFYPKSPSKQFEFGSLEFELIYGKKPDSNVIILPIESKGLRYIKQIPFDQQSLSPEDQGRIVTRDELKGYDAAGK
ncbi:MAG: hypothetical protein KAU20_02520, partial [Nanoarchaeota archaeon]|nr:hypothetical protein [Nanoarchaeota archaeon]